MLRTLNRLAEGRRFYAAVFLFILLFTGMRLAHINADAPQDLTTSAASYTDEGFKTYDARNHALYGSWKWTPEDEYEGWLAKSPLTALPYALIFGRFGASYASVRALSVAYAAGTMLLLVIFLLRNYGRLTALVGLALFGTNYFTAMFNRLGMYESHLIFYIMVFILGASEASRPYRARRGSEGERAYAIKRAACRALFVAVALAGFAGGFFIKRNLLIIIPALAPAALLFLCARLGMRERRMNLAFVLFIALFGAVYLVFAQMDEFKIKLAFMLMSVSVFGQPLGALLPFTAFDPLQNVVLKSLFMEFVFLHPFTFFAGMLLALSTIYNYIYTARRKTADLFLASWLLFGLIFTSVMYYSPSRYYLISIIPLIILAARFIAGFSEFDFASFVAAKKRFPHNIIFGVFILFGLLYTGIVLVEQATPPMLRNYLVDRLYPAYMKGEYGEAAVIIAAVGALCLACVIATVMYRKRLAGLLHDPRLPSLLLSVVLALQVFQYGRWFLFHEHNLYNASRELGRELPPDAIIAGSWSAGLTLENDRRAIILQSLIPYNHNLVKKIIHDIDIPVTGRKGSAVETGYRSGIPLYMAVCRNVIFEKTITGAYREHFTPGNLVKTVRLGYFQVEIFRMNKKRREVKDAVNALFRRFL